MSPARFWAEADIVLGLRHGARSLAVALGAGLALGAWIALADSTIFAGVVPASQHAYFALPMGQLLPRVARGILMDEVLLRLLALPLIVLALRRPGNVGVWPAILLTAWVVWPMFTHDYLAALEWSPLTLAREVTLHCTAGTLWGWLCWRHGWSAGLAGHLAAYGAILPVLAA